MIRFFDFFRLMKSHPRFFSPGGCNGLNGNNATNRFNNLMSSLSNDNYGLSSMLNIEESLSDIAPAVRKKYPFELEKAIHNVKFIQHHMQRQDEFNAVSACLDALLHVLNTFL
jgi:hypothetical protein